MLSGEKPDISQIILMDSLEVFDRVIKNIKTKFSNILNNFTKNKQKNEILKIIERDGNVKNIDLFFDNFLNGGLISEDELYDSLNKYLYRHGTIIFNLAYKFSFNKQYLEEKLSSEDKGLLAHYLNELRNPDYYMKKYNFDIEDFIRKNKGDILTGIYLNNLLKKG